MQRPASVLTVLEIAPLPRPSVPIKMRVPPYLHGIATAVIYRFVQYSRHPEGERGRGRNDQKSLASFARVLYIVDYLGLTLPALATLLEMLNKFRKYTIVIWVQPKHTLTFP
jgi:hypothetical protein